MCAFGAEYTADYWFQKGEEFYYKGTYELARDCYNKSIELDPQNTTILIAIESVNLGLSKYNESLFYDKVIKIDPTSVGAWVGKGNVLQRQGKKYDEAIKAYNNAIAIDPNNSCILWDKGMAFNNQGKFDDAIEAFDRGIQIDPRDDEFWEQKAADLMIMGRYNESITAIDNGIQIAGDAGYLNYMKGSTLELSGRYNESLVAFDEAIQIDPSIATICDTSIGDVFYGLGKYKTALEYYNKSIEQNQSVSDNWYKIGLCLQALGRDSESKEVFAKANGLGLSDAEAMALNGLASHLSGKYNESIEDYNKAIELNPKLGEALGGKMSTLRALHRDSEANAVLRQALSVMTNPVSSELCWPPLPGHTIFSLPKTVQLI